MELLEERGLLPRAPAAREKSNVGVHKTLSLSLSRRDEQSEGRACSQSRSASKKGRNGAKVETCVCVDRRSFEDEPFVDVVAFASAAYTDEQRCAASDRWSSENSLEF